MLAKGTGIDVEFPGGEVVTGIVTHMANSWTTDPRDSTSDPQLAAEISLDSALDSTASLNELDVEVRLLATQARANLGELQALVAAVDDSNAWDWHKALT